MKKKSYLNIEEGNKRWLVHEWWQEVFFFFFFNFSVEIRWFIVKHVHYGAGPSSRSLDPLTLNIYIYIEFYFYFFSSYSVSNARVFISTGSSSSRIHAQARSARVGSKNWRVHKNKHILPIKTKKKKKKKELCYSESLSLFREF